MDYAQLAANPARDGLPGTQIVDQNDYAHESAQLNNKG